MIETMGATSALFIRLAKIINKIHANTEIFKNQTLPIHLYNPNSANVDDICLTYSMCGLYSAIPKEEQVTFILPKTSTEAITVLVGTGIHCYLKMQAFPPKGQTVVESIYGARDIDGFLAFLDRNVARLVNCYSSSSGESKSRVEQLEKLSSEATSKC